MKKSTLLILVLIVMTAHLASGIAEAASPWDTILNAINAMDSKVDSIKGMVSGLQLSINVDERFCAEGFPAQCTDSGDNPGDGDGHTFEVASSSNHNPVLITVLVTRMDGSAVDFLPSDSFIFDPKVGPGPGLRRCGDSQDEVGCGEYDYSFFVATGNGVYTFVVHPSVAGFNWKVASYGFLLTVFDNDGNEGRALGEIVIKE